MRSVLNWTRFRAVLFDLDGVVTPTAEIHERAWSRLFQPWGFTADDYLRYVDGRPRYDGVAAFLASRDVELPWGDPSDPPGDDTICALGNRKNDAFNEVLAAEGIAPYPGTMQVIDLLDEADVAKAIVSSSRNARAVLDAAGLTERFPTVVDGVTATERSLAGKPSPAMFHHAASLLGVDDRDCVVVEDATSGVAAGRAGSFGLVLGVDRGGNLVPLLTAGADLVVDDLASTLIHPSDTTDEEQDS